MLRQGRKNRHASDMASCQGKKGSSSRKEEVTFVGVTGKGFKEEVMSEGAFYGVEEVRYCDL